MITAVLIVRNTVEVHTIWHDVLVATKACGQMHITLHAYAVNEREGPMVECATVLPHVRKPVNGVYLPY
jgi:hypothetical protein